MESRSRPRRPARARRDGRFGPARLEAALHEVEGLPVQEATRRLAQLSDSAGAKAYEAIRALVEEIGSRDPAPGVAGILESSGRTGDDLAAILASHALIHTWLLLGEVRIANSR